MEVKEAEDGDRVRPGLIIIGAGEHHLRLCRDSRGWYVSSKTGDKVSGHCPSVDVLFSSVAENAGENAIGAILTGMGRDGADGLLKMRNAGAFTIGQDKESCVVYGMPMEAIIGMYQAINPSVTGLLDALIKFNMPFTFVKALFSVLITVLIYKHVSPLIKGTKID